MRFPFALLGLSTQIPGQVPLQQSSTNLKNMEVPSSKAFSFNEGPDVFAPKDLVSVQGALLLEIAVNVIHRFNSDDQELLFRTMWETSRLSLIASSLSRTRSIYDFI